MEMRWIRDLAPIGENPEVEVAAVPEHARNREAVHLHGSQGSHDRFPHLSPKEMPKYMEQSATVQDRCSEKRKQLDIVMKR